MTKEQFLAEFKRIAKEFSWGLDRIESVFENKLYCPITAVTFKKTGKFLPINEFLEAGDIIGLSPEITGLIVHAADNLEKCDQTLRYNLLEIIKEANADSH